MRLPPGSGKKMLAGIPRLVLVGSVLVGSSFLGRATSASPRQSVSSADPAQEPAIDEIMRPGHPDRPQGETPSTQGDDAEACRAAHRGNWQEAEDQAASQSMRERLRQRRLPECPTFRPAPVPSP